MAQQHPQATIAESLAFLELQLKNIELLAQLKAVRQRVQKTGIGANLKFPIQACEFSGFLSLDGLIAALEITIKQQ